MVVGGSQQDILNPGFVLLGTRHQGVPVILRELVLPDGFDPVLWYDNQLKLETAEVNESAILMRALI
ncbi:unnamed protein product [Schistosoma curassoni]|uniref:Transcriptional regulator n=1 Tax=Schistosoma curassoni TaxID=6186 RepID=A0A183KMH8_9TREM|nr:unnamed protein product [Schistosoma curassoni]